MSSDQQIVFVTDWGTGMAKAIAHRLIEHDRHVVMLYAKVPKSSLSLK